MNEENGGVLLGKRLRELGEYLIEFAGTEHIAIPPDVLDMESDRKVDDLPHLSRIAKAEYDERRARNQFLDEDLFGEPAWDILLDLFVAWAGGVRISVTSSCIASGVPPTTALRWLLILEDKGLITRSNDVRDKRRIWVELTKAGAQTMVKLLRNTKKKLSKLKVDISTDSLS